MGSEMCIRDSGRRARAVDVEAAAAAAANEIVIASTRRRFEAASVGAASVASRYDAPHYIALTLHYITLTLH